MLLLLIAWLAGDVGSGIPNVDGDVEIGVGTVFSAHDRWNPDPHLACSGKVLRDSWMMVAHPSLPCGTRVRICCLRTHLCAVAVVAERGPRHAAIDMTRAVARRIRHNGKERVAFAVVDKTPHRAPPAARTSEEEAVMSEEHKPNGVRFTAAVVAAVVSALAGTGASVATHRLDPQVASAPPELEHRVAAVEARVQAAEIERAAFTAGVTEKLTTLIDRVTALDAKLDRLGDKRR